MWSKEYAVHWWAYLAYLWLRRFHRANKMNVVMPITHPCSYLWSNKCQNRWATVVPLFMSKGLLLAGWLIFQQWIWWSDLLVKLSWRWRNARADFVFMLVGLFPYTVDSLRLMLGLLKIVWIENTDQTCILACSVRALCIHCCRTNKWAASLILLVSFCRFGIWAGLLPGPVWAIPPVSLNPARI